MIIFRVVKITKKTILIQIPIHLFTNKLKSHVKIYFLKYSIKDPQRPMSQLHQTQHQEEKIQPENQQQNVDVQEQTVDQTNEENKGQLPIQTNLPSPKSPKSGYGSQIILSPKTDASQKILKEQSPALLKGKLDTLRNLYNQKLEEFKKIDMPDNQKQQQLQDLKNQLSDAKKYEEEKTNNAAKIISEKNQRIFQLESQLNNLKSEDISSLHSQKVAQINAEITNANQKLQDREAGEKEQIIQAKLSEKIYSLTQSVQSLKKKKDQVLVFLNSKKQQLSNEKNNLQSILNKLIQTKKTDNFSKLSELETLQKAVELEIQIRKQQISKIRGEIDQVKHSQSAMQTFQAPDLSGLKLSLEETKKQKAQIEKQIQAQQKQFKDVANKVKSQEPTIENKKSKNVQLNEKMKKLEDQKSKLEKEIAEGQKKKQKYEQKIPEQLLALRAKKAELEKQVKQQIERTQKQKNKEDNLVPPSVIETMKQNIANIKRKTELYSKLIVENNNLREENAKLDAIKQGMVWEKSSQDKIVESNLEKQQAKHETLEKQVTEIRAKNIQVANKLEEYVNQYPNFKPQKKQKKPEPVQTQPQSKKQAQQTKKEVQQPTEEKGGKKKKNTKSSPEVSQVFVPEVELQMPSPLTPQQKQIEKKQGPKTGKGKNKSKKQKQPEEPTVQKKEIPAKKQETVSKVEVPKVEAPKVEAPKIEAPKVEAPKVEAPKVQNKGGQGGQGNKNKKKR